MSGTVGHALVFFACGGCYGFPTITADPLPDTDPSISGASAVCDVEGELWQFAIEADAWTGNGVLTLSADGEYLEQHSLPSVSAADDGSGDALERELVITTSRAEAVTNSSTAFQCETPELSGVMQIYSRNGDRVTDCIAFGADPDRWWSWTSDRGCDAVLPTEDSG